MLPKRPSWLYHLLPFHPASSVISILILLCYLPYHYHQLNFFYTVNTIYYNIHSFLSSYILTTLIPEQYSLIGYILIIFLTFLTLISGIYNEDKYEGIRYILSWIGLRVFPILRILLELNTAIASLFMIIDPYTTPLFILTVTINLFFTFLLQNYDNFKDYLNCKSFTYILIFKICLYTNCLLNSIGIWYPSNSMVNVIMTFRFILDLFLFAGYFIYGTQMYKHGSSRVGMMLLVVLHFGLTAGQWADQMFFNLYLYRNANDLLHGVVIVIGVLPFVYAGYLFASERGIEEGSDVRSRCFFFKAKQMGYFDDIGEECFVRGMIVDHANSKCTNPLCYSHQELVYDSQKNKMCDIKKISMNEAAFTKFLMKCWIETNLEDDKIGDKINYAEFLFVNFKNSYQSLHIIEQCAAKFQFPLDKLRLTRLKGEIIKENKKLNKELFNDELDLEFIIDCEKKFECIKLLTNDILKRNLLFWQTVHHNKIDLTELINTVNPNFTTLEEINDNWKDLAQYFDIQKKWKFYYAWFTLYIKNQKLKPVLLEFFTNQVKEEDLFSDLQQYNEKQKQQLSRIIFEQSSAVIHTNSDAKNPHIKKINRYFSKLFGYDQSEILESPLSVLMPPTIAKIHPELFHTWAFTGKSASEPNYKVQKCYVKHKQGYLVAAQKYIKQLVKAEAELEFVGLLKTGCEEEEVIMVGEGMEVEGITEGLWGKLGLKGVWGEYGEMMGVCLILVMPKLVKYSEFREFVTAEDEGLFEVEREKEGRKVNLKFVRKESTVLEKTEEDPNPSPTPIPTSIPPNTPIQLTTQLTVPSNIHSLLSHLRQHNYPSLPLPQKYLLLKQTLLLFSSPSPSTPPLLKFKCSLTLTLHPSPHSYSTLHFTTLTDLLHTQTIQSSRKSTLPKTFHPTDFHKFFQTDENGKVYSLQAANNIFIKQDNNKPLMKLYHIGNLKQMFKLFFLLLVSMCVGALVWNSMEKWKRYKKAGRQLLSINNADLYLTYYETNIYDFHYYNKNLLSPALHTPEFYNSAVAQLHSTYNTITSVKQEFSLKSSLFDIDVNPTVSYSAAALVGPFASLFTNLSYDESDLLIKIFQVSETVVYYPLETLSFTQWYAGFLQMYLTPSFHQLTDTIRSNIYHELETVNSGVEQIITIVLVVQGLIILIWFITAIFKITKIIISFVSIMEVFTQFSQQDVEKIYKYCHFLSTFFQYLKKRDKQQCSSERKETLENLESATKIGGISNLSFNNNNFYEGENNNININKKIKKVEIGSLINRVRLQTYSVIVLYLLVLFGGCFFCTYLIRMRSESVETLYTQGNTHFRYYTTLTNIQSAIQKKSQNSTQYTTVFAPHYASSIRSILSLKTNNSRLIPTPQNFAFTAQYNLVYFQNVCTKFPSALQSNTTLITQCQSVADNSLKYGVQSFVYYFTDQALNYLNDTITLTYDQIFKFEQGLKFVNIFMAALAEEWHEEYQGYLDKREKEMILLTLIVLVAFVVIDVGLFELFVVKGLNGRYEGLRRMYEMYMPDFLVTKEKIIQAKLVVDGIVHK